MIVQLTLAATMTATAHCGNVADAAEQVMLARQSGAPMRDMMETAVESRIELLPHLVEDAYSRPRYSTDRHQQKSVLDFTDQWYLECIRAMRD